MDKLLEALWCRITFSWSERNRLYNLIIDILDNGFSESEMYSLLASEGYSDEVRKVGALSLSGKDETGLFTGLWGQTMFPPIEAALLTVGERNGNMKEMIRVIRESKAKDLSFGNSVLAPVSKVFIAFISLTALLMYFGTSRELFAKLSDGGEPPGYVVWGEILIAWWPWVLLGVGALIGMYVLGHYVLSESVRRQMYPTTLYAVSDRLFSLDVCGLLNSLMRAGESQASALAVLVTIYDGGRKEKLLREALERVNDGEMLAMALSGNVMEVKHAQYLASLAPIGDSESLMKALPAARAFVKEFARMSLTRQLWVFRFVLGIPTGWFVWQTLPLLTGGGMV